MKQFVCGFAAFFAVFGCYNQTNAACSGGAPKTQTVRITPGQRIMSEPQVVSNTITMSGVPKVRVNSNKNANPMYVGGTPMVDVDVRMPDGVARNDFDIEYVAPVGRSGGQGNTSRAYAPRQSYAPQQNYRQPTTAQRSNYVTQPTGYYRGNTASNTQGTSGLRYYGSNANNNSRTGSYQQSRSSESGGAGYVGVHLDLNLLNWSNKYKALPVAYNDVFDHDDYRFKPVIGGNLIAGYRFNPSWRVDAEFGFISEYSDSDNGITFKMSAPYVMANLYHDFVNGLYFGIGAGAAFPTVSMEWENFTANGSSKTAASFAGAAMLGYAYNLSENLILDVRYRFSGFNGTKIQRGVTNWSMQIGNQIVDLESVETKVGFVMDNSVSIGLKYEF